MLQLLCEDYLYIHLDLYLVIQLSELWQHRMNEIAKASKRKRQQKDSNPGH